MGYQIIQHIFYLCKSLGDTLYLDSFMTILQVGRISFGAVESYRAAGDFAGEERGGVNRTICGNRWKKGTALGFYAAQHTRAKRQLIV